MSVVEKELNFGDHGYARRTPLPGLEEEEDADRTASDQQPCTRCQLLKKQLEQEIQHTARLQKEVGGCWCLLQQITLFFLVFFSFSSNVLHFNTSKTLVQMLVVRKEIKNGSATAV